MYPAVTLRSACRNIRDGTGSAENDNDYAALFSDNSVTSTDARGDVIFVKIWFVSEKSKTTTAVRLQVFLLSSCEP